MLSLVDIYPPFGLTLHTPRLELRVLRETDLPVVSQSIIDGIHEKGKSPFLTGWSEAPASEVPLATARFHWSSRAEFRPESWSLLIGVWEQGSFVGVQDIEAKDFPQLRTVTTGSWLRRDAQGRGIGKEMRAAVLSYAFDFLGARTALTSAMDSNSRSQAVTRAMGYQPNGRLPILAAAGVQEEVAYRLEKDGFIRPAWELEVEGHDAVAAFLGLTP